MTGTKTLSEIDILDYAFRYLAGRADFWREQQTAGNVTPETCDTIVEEIDNQLVELEERIEALEGKDNE